MQTEEPKRPRASVVIAAAIIVHLGCWLLLFVTGFGLWFLLHWIIGWGSGWLVFGLKCITFFVVAFFGAFMVVGLGLAPYASWSRALAQLRGEWPNGL